MITPQETSPIDATIQAIGWLEQAFPMMIKFTPERTQIWIGSLEEFRAEWIFAAAKDCIETCKYPPAVAEIRKFCIEHEQRARVEKRHALPALPAIDPFDEEHNHDPVSKAMQTKGSGINAKMLRIQMAMMRAARRNDEPNWRGLGGTDAYYRETCRYGYPKQEQALRDRIEEFDGVPVDAIPALVSKILAESEVSN